MTEELTLKDKLNLLFDQLAEPKVKWNLNVLNLVKELEVEGSSARIKINLITDNPDEVEAFRKAIIEGAQQLGATEVDLEIGHVNIATEGISGAQRIILVGSGKGGVGKSSVAMNLAAGLVKAGYKVGLMDADIYGPSVPIMVGSHAKPEVLADDYLGPVISHGIKTMSVGYLFDEGKSIDWRGSMAAGTLLQFIRKTLWGKLDYLVVDLPPGTGDVQLTLAHQMKADGAVIVTTPQEVVLGDVRRSLDQLEAHKIPVLGIVENMSFFRCVHCGGINHPFPSSDHGLDHDLPRLANIPLMKAVANGGDKGKPVVLDEENGAEAKEAFEHLAAKVAELVPVR